MKRVVISIFLLTCFINNCSAVNYWSIYTSANDTNPTKEYSNPYHIIFKGGYLFHLNHSPGQVGNNVQAIYSGESCSHSILNLVAFGDSSIDKALKNGHLKKIASVSHEQFGVFLFYHRFCTTVTGE